MSLSSPIPARRRRRGVDTGLGGRRSGSIARAAFRPRLLVFLFFVTFRCRAVRSFLAAVMRISSPHSRQHGVADQRGVRPQRGVRAGGRIQPTGDVLMSGIRASGQAVENLAIDFGRPREHEGDLDEANSVNCFVRFSAPAVCLADEGSTSTIAPAST